MVCSVYSYIRIQQIGHSRTTNTTVTAVLITINDNGIDAVGWLTACDRCFINYSVKLLRSTYHTCSCIILGVGVQQYSGRIHDIQQHHIVHCCCCCNLHVTRAEAHYYIAVSDHHDRLTAVNCCQLTSITIANKNRKQDHLLPVGLVSYADVNTYCCNCCTAVNTFCILVYTSKAVFAHHILVYNILHGVQHV